MTYKKFFKNKKVTLMGLGLLGGGLGKAQFLAECGANLTVTDLKSAKELASSLKKLKKFGKKILYVLGEHRVEDFTEADMVIKAAGVPLDSPCVAAARARGVAVEMDDSLFAKLAPEVTLIGITGTRGKTTTSTLIYNILKHAKKKLKWSRNVFLAGNIRGVATLPLLKKVKKGDIVVLELSSWQLQGFGDSSMSPHIAVFTNFLDDHLNYYAGDRQSYWQDKAYIFSNQKENDYIVAPKNLLKKIQQEYPKLKSHFMLPFLIPSTWKLHLRGEHNKQNIALACAVGSILDVDEKTMQEAVAHFHSVEGRLELVAKIRGVAVYNDTTSTTPDSLIAALAALSEDKNIVLIMGGADKNLDMKPALDFIPHCVTTVIVLPGTGTEKIKSDLHALPDVHVVDAESLDDALRKSFFFARPGDSILFSPGFASFGMFVNEFDRGDRFNVAVKKFEAEIKKTKPHKKKSSGFA